MDIQFLGAAQSVTGSKYVIRVGGRDILLECGLFQGRREESFSRNRSLPFDPAGIDAMVLSHAHIDHSGNIPTLVKHGFRGSVYCTHATQDLARIMLRDSAYLQERDVEFVNKRHRRKGLPPVQALYTVEDAERCLNHFVGVGYDRPISISPHVRVVFHDAGHILGSAVVVLDLSENGRTCRIAFTGDLGRRNLPVIRDPVQVSEADILITESTYGDRLHDSLDDMKPRLRRIIDDTVRRGGKVIIPAFSVGRTQEIVYVLHELYTGGLLPRIPIFVDSPLSASATAIFRIHPECFDGETRRLFLMRDEDPFGFHLLRYIKEVDESKKLNTMDEPCIIISASGMCEGGRVLHHLANHIPDARNMVLVVGFMAENTLGRRIVEKHPTVRIFGDEVPLNARVEIMNGFSAHADRNELIGYFKGLDGRRLRHVFVVHGEPEQSRSLAEAIRETGFDRVSVPSLGDRIKL